MVGSAILLLVALVAIDATPLNHQLYMPMWNEFKQTHGKSYQSATEEIARFNIFIENQRKIDAHNEKFKAGLHSFDMGMNQFGDMTHEEFRTKMNGYKQKSKPSAASIFQAAVADIPKSVDWRTKGYVTPVKDQGQCGSCWAFSAVASLEGQHFKKAGKLVSLSEQNLVDCSDSFGNEGCNGGLMDQAFAYIKANKGIDTETSYPYKAIDESCRFSKSNIGATDTGFTDIKTGDESDLENAIATVGPISVAIDASQDSFQFYKSGVYYEPDCSSEQLDHGVTAVGYDTSSDGKKYYIVKNSWGLSWGNKGYIWMSREHDNNCGIATAASYPLV
jgi:cathepsin L